ncbi:hypothetical protein HF521_012422 [Silurus meridionalis]|uniref:Ig-like domain-containing protein n=1 Tax=Silurus meridionalis TaxID=175797 RepID=A0A8T0AH32_SILME|nr:hypothetical protein HF521_012422 [Silurus meridionalis]
MISLYVAFYSLLCVCTAGKTSDIKELHVETVKRGEDVTIECNLSMIKDKIHLAWYRQSFGKVPQFLAKPYSNNLGYTFDSEFADIRYSITVNDRQFDLNINDTREEDSGEYFCGEMEGNMIRFTAGTRLEIEDKETNHHPSTRKLKTTESVTIPSRSNSSNVVGEACNDNIHMFFWLSISRVGVLLIMVISFTTFYIVLKSGC